MVAAYHNLRKQIKLFVLAHELITSLLVVNLYSVVHAVSILEYAKSALFYFCERLDPCRICGLY